MPADIHQQLAQNVFAARTALGISQGELADRARCSRATIAQIEAGQGNPTLGTVADLARELHAPVVMLVVGESELTALAMIASGVVPFEGLEQADFEKLRAPLQELERLRASPLPSARKQLVKQATDVVPESIDHSTEAKVGAAIGSFLLPGFGTFLGAAIGAFTKDKKT